MNFEVLLTNEALGDIEQAVVWYSSKQIGFGKEFSEIVFEYLEYLSRNAHSHRKIRKEYRELVMKRFPYVIVYRVITEKQVLILGVIHTKRHPSNRKKGK